MGLVMNMRFIFGEDCNDVISLESRPLNFPVFIHAYSLRNDPRSVTQTRQKSQGVLPEKLGWDVRHAS